MTTCINGRNQSLIRQLTECPPQGFGRRIDQIVVFTVLPIEVRPHAVSISIFKLIELANSVVAIFRRRGIAEDLEGLAEVTLSDRIVAELKRSQYVSPEIASIIEEVLMKSAILNVSADCGSSRHHSLRWTQWEVLVRIPADNTVQKQPGFVAGTCSEMNDDRMQIIANRCSNPVEMFSVPLNHVGGPLSIHDAETSKSDATREF